MAKKNEFKDETKYVTSQLEDIMSDRFSRYAKYIIQERALPDARDGLKPVQRRILYAMYHDGNTYDHPYRKSAKTVGLVIGNYHPHGDTSVYDAMVRMSQDWKVRLPLIDMHGNNGSIDDDPAAAMRYTEARLSKVTQVMENDLDKNTVEMAPNFDDTEVEPTVLPVPFPVMLVNGATGIAAGYATNMPPHNMQEVIDATIYRIQNPDCSLAEIMEIMPGPDFPTGGIVQGSQGIKEAFETGKGRIVVRAKAEVIEEKLCNKILIREIPYEVIKANLVKQMDEIRLNKEIDGILDVRDESDRMGLKIVVDVRKEVDANMILNYFYKNTDLQVYYNYNNVTIIDQRPVQVGILGLIDAFVAFRKEVVTRRSKYEYDRMESRCHVIEGLMKAVSVVDEVIQIIRKSKDKADSKKNLMERFHFDEVQAEAIVTLRLYRLSNTDITELRNEFAQLVNRMEEIKAILENANVLSHVIIKELKEVKKEYGDTRRTKIEDEISQLVIDKSSMVASERVVVTVSGDGYVKRVSLRSYKSSEGTLTGMKENDNLIGSIECDTLDTLLLFTSKGNYAYVPVYQITEGKWKEIGTHLNKIVRIDGDDKIINAILVKDFQTWAWVISVTSNGMIKRTPLREFQPQRTNKVLPAIHLASNAEVKKVFLAYADDDILVVSKEGYGARYTLDQISSMSVKSRGVKAQNYGAQDSLASACAFSKNQSYVYLLCTNGSMKRIKSEEMELNNRPVRGILMAKKVKSNPNYVKEMRPLDASDELLFHRPDTALRGVNVPLKTREQTYSTPVAFQKDFYLEKGIEEAQIVDIPKDEKEEIHEDIEVQTLFD